MALAVASDRALSEEAALSDLAERGIVYPQNETCVLPIKLPSSLEGEKLARSRFLNVRLIFIFPLAPGFTTAEVEAMAEEAMHLSGLDVDAQVLHLFYKLHQQVGGYDDNITLLLKRAFPSLPSSRLICEHPDLDDDEESRANLAVLELGITAEMAQTMVDLILPAVHAGHHLAMAQALAQVLDLLLSSGVLESLTLATTYDFSAPIYAGWGAFFHRALSSHESRLRTLSLVRKKLLDEGASRELCKALAKSNLQELFWYEGDGLDQEEEELLSRAIVSQGCNLKSLHVLLSEGTECKSLSNSLLHPNCKIWDFGVFGASALSLVDVLRNGKLLKLSLSYVPEFIPWEAMEDPACKVEALSLHRPWKTRRSAPQPIRGSDAQLARLLQAASSKIWCLKVDEAFMDIVKALEHNKVTHFDFMKIRGKSVVQALADFLGSAHCKLQWLRARDLALEDADVILGAIENNYQSRLKTLKLLAYPGGNHVAERCSHIEKRTALFLGSTQEPFVAATSAKLFICGHSGAGKTTIAKNFNRRVMIPTLLQRHPTTQGIGMGVLDYNGKKAVICDTAGQQEFHAFHHYFVKGSQSNLFLIVCKVFTDKNNDNMEQDIKYWLRFISSHKDLSSKRKPKVLIALNYHGDGKFNTACVEAVTKLAQQYSGLLDIYKNGGDKMCFEVVALRPADLKPIKATIGVALEDVLRSHPHVPALCKVVRDSINRRKTRWWCYAQETPEERIVTIEELAQRVLPPNDDNKAASISAVKFTMACMHDMGESLYFGVDYENDNVLANSATLDMQWFVQELVGIFIKVSRDDDQLWTKARHKQEQIQRQQGVYKVCMINIVPRIEKMCSPDHLGYVLKALHEMGVLLPADDDWNGAWTRTHPEKVIVPALLQNGFSRRNWGSEKHIYWGRRLACKDQVCTLLPSGMFNVIQVKVRELCKNQSFRVGKGWVFFEENRVCACIMVGGDTRHWVDRQWVDIMVMTPNEHKKCLLAENMVNQIKSYVAKECQSSLELVEYVLNPTHVRAVQEDMKEAARLEDICKEALDEGLEYSHTWEMETSNEIAELLMPRELQGYVKEWESSIEVDFNESVASVYDIREVEPWEHFFERHSSSALMSSTSGIEPELMEILMCLFQEVYSVKAGINDLKVIASQTQKAMEAGIKDLKGIANHTQKTMEAYGQKVLGECSKMLDKLDVNCPRYPYFTSLDNKIAAHYLVVAERVKLHYCCESSFKGIHQVMRQDGSEPEGLVLELAHGWFKKYSYIIAPAITGIFMAMKIAGTAVGVGAFSDVVLDFSKGMVADALNSVLTSDVARNNEGNLRCPSESDLNELFAMVSKKAESQRMDHFMMKAFGLRLNNRAWLCDACFRSC